MEWVEDENNATSFPRSFLLFWLRPRGDRLARFSRVLDVQYGCFPSRPLIPAAPLKEMRYNATPSCLWQTSFHCPLFLPLSPDKRLHLEVMYVGREASWSFWNVCVVISIVCKWMVVAGRNTVETIRVSKYVAWCRLSFSSVDIPECGKRPCFLPYDRQTRVSACFKDYK